MRKVQSLLVIFVAALLMLMSTGCGNPPMLYPTAELMGGTTQGDFNAKVEEAKGHWEKRSDRGELEAAIKSWEEAVAIADSGMSEAQRKTAVFEIYHQLSRAHYFLADGHMRFTAEEPMSPGDEDPVKAEMEVTFEKGMNYGSKALALYSEDYNVGIAIDRPIEKIAQKLDAGAVPAMYWWATNLGKWALSRGITSALEEIGNVKAIMQRVVDLQPDYYYYAPYRYFGAFYTTTPGGKLLDKSKKLFDIALEKAPEYTGNRVVFAEFYAYQANDDALMERLLREAAQADVGTNPNSQPENAAEKKKAEILLEENF